MPSISVPTAIIGASVIGGAATAIGASSAASSQQKAAQSAQQTQKQMFEENKALLQPWSDKGLQDYTTLNKLLGAGGDSASIQKTLEGLPGYQFTLGQGLKSTQSGYAARGLADSGGALKGAADYATGLAQNTYGNYVNQLQSAAGLGESAAASLGGAATTAGQGIAGSQIAQGNAAAAGANAVGGAVSGTTSGLGQYYTLKNLLQSTQQPGTSDPGYFFGGDYNYAG